GQEHFARFGDLSDVDLLITDSGLSPAPGVPRSPSGCLPGPDRAQRALISGRGAAARSAGGRRAG
ncbi:D-beta-D-heptose 1-phosphate adenosyltransferase, partial [Streptomyces pharetrae]